MADIKTLKPGFCCYGIVDHCMLRCKMCYKWKEDIHIEDHRGIPTMDDWKRCADSLREIVDDEFLINFGGGEPLLKRDIFDLVTHCKKMGFTTNIATNGYFIDRDMAKRIADSGLSSINISLDSIEEKVHDYLRGVPGVYRRVMDAIEYLDKYCRDFQIIICSVIYNVNLDTLLDLIRWANANTRITRIIFMAAMQPNNTVPDGNWHKKEFSFLWPKDTHRTDDILNEIIDMKEKGFKIHNPSFQLEAFKSYFKNPYSFVKKFSCNLDKAVHVSSTGDIFICYKWDKLGNIKRDSLSEAWYSEKAEEVRNKIKSCKENCHFLLNCYFENN